MYVKELESLRPQEIGKRQKWKDEKMVNEWNRVLAAIVIVIVIAIWLGLSSIVGKRL